METGDNQDLNSMVKSQEINAPHKRTVLPTPATLFAYMPTKSITLKKRKTDQHPQKYPLKPSLEYVAIINIFLWKLSHAI